MAEQQHRDFSIRWEESFPGVALPDLDTLDVLRDSSGSVEKLNVALEEDSKSLTIREETLQKQLDQVQFCLTWINEAKMAEPSDILGEGDSGPGTGTRTHQERSDTTPTEGIEIPSAEIAKTFNRDRRAFSLAGEKVEELRSWEKRRSSNSCKHVTETEVLEMVGSRGKSPYENVRTVSRSLNDLSCKPAVPDLPPRPATYPQTDQEVSQKRRSMHSANFTRILEELCDRIPKEKEELLLISLGYTSYADVSLRDRLLLGTKVTETNPGLLVLALQNTNLGHLVEVLRSGKQPPGDPKPTKKKKRPSDLRFELLSKPLANFGADYPTSPLASPTTPVGDVFKFGIRVIGDYRPSGGSAEPPTGGFRRFTLMRGQLMDVIGVHAGGTLGEQYIARNADTEMGLVPKEKCAVDHEATPIIWSKEWFASAPNVKHYSDLIAHAQTGTFYIRNCSHKVGDFVLVVKTGTKPTKFQIGVGGSSYSITSRSSGTRSFVSLDELITFYKAHSLTVEDQTSICLTIPCKRMDSVSR